MFYLRSPFLLHNGKEIFLFSSSFLGEAFTLNLWSLPKYFCVYWINHWLVFSIYCFLYPPPKSNPKLFSKHQSPLRQVNYLFPAKVISYTLWPRIWTSSPPPTPGAQLSFGTPQQLPGAPSLLPCVGSISWSLCLPPAFWENICENILNSWMSEMSLFYPHTQLMTCLDWKQLCAQLLSHAQRFVTPWTLAHQVPLTVGFSTGVGCHFLLFT